MTPNWRKLIGFAVQAIVAGLAAAFVIVALRPELIAPPAPHAAIAAPLQASPLLVPQAVVSYADAVAATAPAVVSVYTGRAPLVDGSTERLRRLLNPLAPVPQENSLGSGVVVDESGFVLTNEHVIRDADSIHVALLDGRLSEAELVGTDPDTDLALLRIGLDNLPSIPLGRSDTLRIGDVVLAIGNPFGIGQTVTQGIVSATGRSPGLSIFENFVQTDASINPGNSGGALVDTHGRLIGINTAMFSRNDGSEGIGFAIPVNLARGVMDQLLEHGRVIRGWLGVNALDITPAMVRDLGLPDPQGILLTGVFPQGPASRAGLRAGDIITRLNHNPVISLQDALNRIARLSPGTAVEVKGQRNGSDFEVEARVIERPIRPRGG